VFGKVDTGRKSINLTLIQNIREKMWERVVSEDQMIPNADALKLHWQRCCWVFSYWKQTQSKKVFLPQP
jgi:hypothetical protein